MNHYYYIIILGLAVACSNPGRNLKEDSQSKGNLAAQLWTFRYDLEKNVPGTLKKIKDLGFDYVEGFDAPYITGDPESFRAELDAAGLKMFALHWNTLDDWRNDPAVILETAKKMGAQYTGIAWLKYTTEDTVTLEVVNEAAEILMNTCTQAEEAGLQLYYHIHGYEFQPLDDGKTFFDSFVSRIDYSCVRLEMDAFWVTYAGLDPVQFMSTYGDGIELLHIKNMADHVQTGVFTGADFMPPDMPADFWVPLGKGKIDYKSVFQKGHEIGVKWYIIEMDKFDGDVYAAVDSSLAYIKSERLIEN